MLNTAILDKKFKKAFQVFLFFLSFTVLFSLAAFILLMVYQNELQAFSWLQTAQLTTFLVFIIGQISMVLIMGGSEFLELFKANSGPTGDLAFVFIFFIIFFILFRILIVTLKFIVVSVMSHIIIFKMCKIPALLCWIVLIALVVTTVAGVNITKATQSNAATQFVETELKEKISASQGVFTLSEEELAYISKYAGKPVTAKEVWNLDACRAIIFDHMSELMAQDDIPSLLQFIANMKKHGFEFMGSDLIAIVFSDADIEKISKHISANGTEMEFVRKGIGTYFYLGIEIQLLEDVIYLKFDGETIGFSGLSHWKSNDYSYYGRAAIVIGTEYTYANRIWRD